MILGIKSALEQVIDEETHDTLLRAGFDEAAKAKAKSMLTNFRQFLEDHKDEIEAIQVLYSKPHRAGLRYRQVKELAEALKRPPLSLPDPCERLWQLYEAVEPDQGEGQRRKGPGRSDRLGSARPAPGGTDWFPWARKSNSGIKTGSRTNSKQAETFTAEQRQWLDAIKDHIANSLSIDQDDLEDVPFSQLGGLGKAYQLFGEELAPLLEELNARLAA